LRIQFKARTLRVKLHNDDITAVWCS